MSDTERKKRAITNKRKRQEALREELRAREYLRQIQDVADVIDENWASIEANQINALKLKADLNFKRLAKCLPDLKSVELTGGSDEDAPLSLTVTVVKD